MEEEEDSFKIDNHGAEAQLLSMLKSKYFDHFFKFMQTFYNLYQKLACLSP